MASPTISVVVPTLNAGPAIDTLLDLLAGQTLPPIEVLVVDSASTDGTRERAAAHEGVAILSIERANFDHGLTRDMALRRTSGEFVLFMTQDAVPASSRLVERVAAPMLADPQVAQVTGRQLPKADARRFEQLVRGFNYPEASNVRGPGDVASMGVKAFYSSDVCCCYRRSAYLAAGGFTATDMSEDMLMSCRLVRAGYKIAYAASACVYHSHNLTPRQQYARNRAVGAFLERNAAELDCGSEVGEGMRMVKEISKTLLREGRVGELAAFSVDCAARLLGNRAGRREEARRSLTNAPQPSDGQIADAAKEAN